MPSAANGKTEKPTSSEANNTENLSPVRQIMVILDHKIRNLEKRKGKLTSYRDLQKSGKELNADQKVAVAKYDEVTQTLEFARDLSKQVTSICASSEKEAKKQAKKEAWLKAASETNKIRDVLLVLDCLIQLGNEDTRADFIAGNNGAAKLTEEDLKILDELYPEVTPKHENGEDGSPAFLVHALRAAEHLCCIVDAKQKEFLGTTYARIKEIVTLVHDCGYFDHSHEEPQPEQFQEEEICLTPNQPEESPLESTPPPNATHYPSPPPPQPAYPLRPMPPITLQEVEHAYFAQQYAQQRPISEVIGSQGFFFLQESEIESPVPTPQPPPPHLPPTVLGPPPPPMAIPTQTFTNQNFMSRAAPAAGALPMPGPILAAVPPLPPQQIFLPPASEPSPPPAQPPSPPKPAREYSPPKQASPPPPAEASPPNESPERHERGRNHDAPPRDGRYRRYGRGGPRGHSDNYRGGGRSYQNGRHDYYRNGDGGDGDRSAEGEPRYNDSYKGRGRGGRPRGTGPRRPPPSHYNRRAAE